MPISIGDRDVSFRPKDIDSILYRTGSYIVSALRYNEDAMKLEIELEVPDGAVDKGGEAELVRSVKEQTALKLYSEQRVTTGEAAEMLGLTRIQFLDLLRRTGVGFHVELDEEDFAQIRRWRDDKAVQSGR
jgi:predicted HTH domain antitoxin